MCFPFLLSHPTKRHRHRILSFIIISHLLFFCLPKSLSPSPHFLFATPADTKFRVPPSQTLTFIFVPKPYPTPYDISMAKLVLQVCLSYPFSRILMFRNQSEYDPTNEIVPFIYQTFGSQRLQFASALSTGYKNRPLLRNWFIEGCRLVKNGYLCFLNGDIIIPPLWMNAAMAIFEAFRETEFSRTLIFGVRTDIYKRDGIFDLPKNASTFLYSLVDWLQQNIRGDGPYGMDALLIHSSFNALNWMELPDFVIGMPVWDNYFMGWANERANTVSMDFGPKLFHIDHEGGHLSHENFEYFRTMSARSPHFAGFQEHHQATWLVRLNEGRLIKRWHQKSVSFKRSIDGVIRPVFD